MSDYLIVGAGISGLTAGFYLKRAGHRVTIVEGSSRAGGVVKTLMQDGFILESGPNSILAKPAILELLADLNLMDQILWPEAIAKKRFIATDDNRALINATPDGFWSAVSSPILSFGAKLRLLAEPFIRRNLADDESVQAFSNRRFGREFTSRVLAPALAGIWAADISTLSVRSALPKLFAFEKEAGSVVRGGIKQLMAKSNVRVKTRSGLFTLRNGNASITEALAGSFSKEELLLDTALCGIVPNLTGFSAQLRTGAQERELVFDKVVVTVSASETARVIRTLDANLAQKLEAIPYAPIGVMHLAFKQGHVLHPLNGFGFLVPPTAPFAVSGVIFSSQIFPGRAPEGYHLLTAFVGGAAKRGLSDVGDLALASRVVAEIKRFIGATDTPKILHSCHWEKAIPNYPLNHHLTQFALREFEHKFPGISFQANWDRGISLPDRVERAREFVN